MRISITLPDEVIAKVDALAKEMGLTRSGCISMLISKEAKEAQIVRYMPIMMDAYQNEQLKLQEISGNSGN